MASPWALTFSSGERPRALWALLFYLVRVLCKSHNSNFVPKLNGTFNASLDTHSVKLLVKKAILRPEKVTWNKNLDKKTFLNVLCKNCVQNCFNEVIALKMHSLYHDILIISHKLCSTTEHHIVKVVGTQKNNAT